MLKNVTWLLCGLCFLPICGCYCHADQVVGVGPRHYLTYMGPFMEGYREEYGSYPTRIEEVESYARRQSSYLDVSRGLEYTYRIVEATDRFYHIVSGNGRGLRDHELTSDMEYPVWVFKDIEDRREAKEIVLSRVTELSSLRLPREQNVLIFDLVYFPDQDTKRFLIDLCLTMGPSEREGEIRDKALLTLEDIIDGSDKGLVQELLTVYRSIPEPTWGNVAIIEMLGTIKDRQALGFLEEVVDQVGEDERSTPQMMKGAARRAIEEILEAAGR